MCPPNCDQSGEDCPLEYVPNFVKLAKAYGASGFFVDDPKDLDETLKKALNTPGPVIVECRIDREVNVYPMVPAGAPLDQMIRGMA